MQYLILVFGGMVMSAFLMGLLSWPIPKNRPRMERKSFIFSCAGNIGVGEKGENSEKNTETNQQEESQIIYTPEQSAFLQNMMSGATGTSSSLMDAINQQLNAGLTGEPTTAEKARTLQEKQGIDNTYKNLTQQSSEALAGRGTLDSGVANKVMANMQAGQAGANQSADVASTQRQQEDFMNAIRSALGLTGIASGMASVPQGKTGNTWNQENEDFWKNNWTAGLALAI